MSPSKDVLLFGRDAGLQQTRAWILNKDGFRVDTPSSLYELKTCLSARIYGLLVLCHSLSAADRSAAISIAASWLPEVKLLAVEKQAPGTLVSPFAHVVRISSGPEGFRSAVHALLNVNETPSRLLQRKITVTRSGGTVKWFNNARSEFS